MSKNSFTPEELEQIRAMLEEAIRENVPKSQQVQAQQLIPDLLALITQLPATLITVAGGIVGGATGILSTLISSLINILSQLLGFLTGPGGAGASIMQSLAPSLVNVITKHVPVSEAQKQHIQQQIEQQLAPKNPNLAPQNNQ
ncbi:hypothetical protein [Thermoactinomyces mirandus]|uniref:Uncharacterized protein n=1 Tax=Thermoactinomyces mirandus TaxID=2756294 RepID=A0A7W2ARL7_9BACL|nr:hypothetical protein [Thermoactinomyces mirandus]MBA4602512.1 hypothetical protein [Thermoactinomyces mirandus]